MVASYRSVTSVPTAELIRTGSQWVKGFEGRYTYNAQTRILYYVCVEQKKLMPKATNTGSQFAWTLNKESKSYGTFTHAMLVAMLMGKVPVQATLGLNDPAQKQDDTNSRLREKRFAVVFDVGDLSDYATALATARQVANSPNHPTDVDVFVVEVEAKVISSNSPIKIIQ
jgi:hypothetical protein